MLVDLRFKDKLHPKTNRPLVLEQRQIEAWFSRKARAAKKRGRLASSSDEDEIGSDASSCSDDEDNPTDVTEAARVMGEDRFKKYKLQRAEGHVRCTQSHPQGEKI
jgi:hypothetical protein